MTESQFEDYIESMYKYVSATATLNDRRILERGTIVLTDEKAAIFIGALEIEAPKSMDEILSVLKRLDNYRIYSGVTTQDELGRYLVEAGEVKIAEDNLPYINFSLVAAEHERNNSGIFTVTGYVFKVRGGEPEPRNYLIKVELSSPRLNKYNARYPLYLPASGTDINNAMAVLGVDSFEKCGIENTYVNIESLPELHPANTEIETLNALAAEAFELHKSCPLANTFEAAVSIEQPDSIAGLLEIAKYITRYELAPVSDAQEYGEWLLYDTCEYNARGNESFEAFKDEVRDYIDFKSYGEYRIKEYGVQVTDFGLLRRIDQPFEAEKSELQSMSM